MVNYEYNNNIGEIITFKNFLITSKDIKHAEAMRKGIDNN
jgi:hypothetical protein